MNRPLNVSLNIKQVEGPAGGGVAFASALERGLTQRGWRVCRDLRAGLDALLLLSFRNGSDYASYTPHQAAEYLTAHPNTVSLLRVNDSDQARFVSTGINRSAAQAQQIVDHTVFVSDFIKNLHLSEGLDPDRPVSVIRNAAPAHLFHANNRAVWDGKSPLRLVTHHWSPAYTKGHDIYERLDQLLGMPQWSKRFHFSYVGTVPLGLSYANARMVPLISGHQLGDELRSHHAYITAARGEAAPMHAIEAMQCGLPVLHLNSGSMPEYCSQGGLSFTLADFESKLSALPDLYPSLVGQLAQRPDYGVERMVDAYAHLIEGLVVERRATPRREPSNLQKAGLSIARLGRRGRAACLRMRRVFQ